jgi:hypothetical protein
MRRVNQSAGATSTIVNGGPAACVLSGLVAFAVVFAGCGGLADPSAEGIHARLDQPVYAYQESFEQGFGGWITDHSLECSPGCGLLDGSIRHSSSVALDGAFGLRSYLNGNHGDGTIWVEQSFPIHPPERERYRVTLSFYLWSDGLTPLDTWPVVAYIGHKNPEIAADFTTIGKTNGSAGWKAYSLVQTVRFDDTRPLQVALGITATAEVARTYFIDLVSLTVE